MIASAAVTSTTYKPQRRIFFHVRGRILGLAISVCANCLRCDARRLLFGECRLRLPLFLLLLSGNLFLPIGRNAGHAVLYIVNTT